MISFAEISIIVPCKNESENILTLNGLMGNIPKDLELIFVEGGSEDDTAEQCRNMALNFPNQVKLLTQSKKGKMNAVMEGINSSSRKHIAIFDADLTVSLQDQLRLIQIYSQNDGKSFVTGNRLNRRIHSGSMQRANFIANYSFGLLFSIVMRNRIVDTLCGTKIFPREIVMAPRCKKIVTNDPFGDFAMILNGWLFDLKIESINVEYLPRRYGATNIKRWTSGILLTKIFIEFIINHGATRKRKLRDLK
jgi:glycosyltransferase involved in cell wall biosynthesis